MPWAETLSRRDFLRLAAAAWLAALPPQNTFARSRRLHRPTRVARAPSGRKPRTGEFVYFTPVEAYRPLPPGTYEDSLIVPREIILHWDGNRRGRELWLVEITYQTLALLGNSAHFAVDRFQVWQMLPMYAWRVQEAHGARGYNDRAIHIEMAGVNFDAGANLPPERETRQALHLALALMLYYEIPFESVYGHYERDLPPPSLDPGREYMEYFRGLLAARLKALPAQRRALYARDG